MEMEPAGEKAEEAVRAEEAVEAEEAVRAEEAVETERARRAEEAVETGAAMNAEEAVDTEEAGKAKEAAGTEENMGRPDWEHTSEKELRALKLWLFSENVRIEAEKKKLLESRNHFLKERVQFQEEMKILNQKVTAARQRLRQDEQFFDKKMEILKNGFSQLDMDRKAFEREKEAAKIRAREEKIRSEAFLEDMEIFYAGVKNQLALKKRYKDLLKIYHPDNVAGDKEIMQKISREYERLKRIL